MLCQCGVFLSKELSGKIAAYLKRCYPYEFSSKIERVYTLFDTACMELFQYALLVIVWMVFYLLSIINVMIYGSLLIDMFYGSVSAICYIFVNYCLYIEL